MSFFNIGPIIKKNLIITKRNIIKSLLQIFYPTIILMIYYFAINLQPYKIPAQNYNFLQESYTFEKYSNSDNKIDWGDLAVIASNETNPVNQKSLQNFISKKSKKIFYKKYIFLLFSLIKF